jgi:hypothetical protein
MNEPIYTDDSTVLGDGTPEHPLMSTGIGVDDIFGGTGIVVTPNDPAAGNVTISASGGGGASNTPIWPPILPNSVNNGWAGFSMISILQGAFIRMPVNSWSLGIMFAGGTVSGFQIGSGLMVRTLAGTTTIVDVTTLEWGGVADPVINQSGAFVLWTDAITKPVDSLHDYYVMIFWESGTINLGEFNTTIEGGVLDVPWVAKEESGNQLPSWSTAIPSGFSGSTFGFFDTRQIS